mgnify:CR=1 FL=1
MLAPPRSLTRDEVRAIDVWAAETIGLPTLVLMENAGRGAAEVLLDRIHEDAKVLVLCGPGNNGGDGAVVARHLDLSRRTVSVVWFAKSDRLSPDAATQHRVLKGLGLPQDEWPESTEASVLDELLAEADWVVDGLLGTGLSRPVEGQLRDVIEAINRSGRPVLALDLPSGLDTDRGVPLGTAVRATVTATFVARKVGFDASGAAAFTGEVHVVPIGVPARWQGA